MDPMVKVLYSLIESLILEDFKSKEDPYAALKAAASDPTKQIRVKNHQGNNPWINHDDGFWSFCLPPDDYEIRDKPAPDPYAALKAAAKDPTKQVRIKGGFWKNAGESNFDWSKEVDKYQIRDKPKVDMTRWVILNAGRLTLTPKEYYLKQDVEEVYPGVKVLGRFIPE